MSILLTIDVAHPPRSASAVESELNDAWARVRNSSTLRLLKIIHGHGSTGKGGTTKEVVRNWAFTNRTRFLALVEGEQYSLFDPQSQKIRGEIGHFDDPDVDRSNPGILLIWVK